MIIQSGITIGSNITIGDLPTSPYLPPYLYEFSTFTFRTGNITGPTGPNTAQLFANSYSNVGNTWLQSSAYFTTTGNGYQFWTVPQTGSYQITAAGARSGYSQFSGNTAWAANSAGRGVTMQATVPLTQGQVITIAVGQPSANAPVSASFSVPGGGGGTFVVFTNNNAPIIVAGGAGGAGNWSSNTAYTIFRNGGNAVTTTWGGNSWAGAPGGFNGWGGNSHVNLVGVVSTNAYDGGGGGGFYSNGVSGSGANVRTGVAGTVSTGAGGRGFFANLIGGARTAQYSTQTSDGGFGGGSGPGAITGAGGGGYSGGGGAFGPTGTTIDSGGGGGSYIIEGATNVATTDGNYNGSNSFSGAGITNLGTDSYNLGHGYVTITKV